MHSSLEDIHQSILSQIKEINPKVKVLLSRGYSIDAMIGRNWKAQKLSNGGSNL